jgi:hypothetical protein
MVLKAFENLFPGSGVTRRAPMRGESLVKQDPLPFMKGNLIDVGGDPVPQRLHVVDLVLNCQPVESRWW